MAKPFDVTTKALIETRPQDWLTLLGLGPVGRVRVIDADIATVTAAADKILRVEAAQPWLLHLELQAGHDADLPSRVHVYNALLHYRHRLPVRSVIVLLRREADRASLTGTLQRWFSGEEPYETFRYRVVRTWELPVETVLQGGMATLPLAPLCGVESTDVHSVVRRMKDRLEREVPPATADVLWVATYFLLGLRFSKEVATRILRGVMTMKESVTYQAMMSEGRAEGIALGRVEGRAQGRAEGRSEGAVNEARKFLLRIGRKQLGQPQPETVTAIEAISDLARLEELGERLLESASWQELLALPRPRRSRRQKPAR